MSARKTESRLPAGLQPGDLGEAVIGADGRSALVSFITAPLAPLRKNTYVVFVTDAALAGVVQSFEWSFVEDGGTPNVQTTEFGQVSYVPQAEGYLELTVRMLDAGAAEQATLSITQQIGPLNPGLELRIAAASAQPGPGAGNPDVMRELLNDHNPYYLDVALRTPEPGDAFKRFVFTTLCDGASIRTPDTRGGDLDRVAESLNSGAPDFVAAVAPGLGVAAIRMSLAAMMLAPNSIPFTELPAANPGNAVEDERLRAQLAALAENDRVDLFNRLRFPKANINDGARLLEALRDKFFSGVTFDDVLTKMSGTMANWIALNYHRGPLPRS